MQCKKLTLLIEYTICTSRVNVLTFFNVSLLSHWRLLLFDNDNVDEDSGEESRYFSNQTYM